MKKVLIAVAFFMPLQALAGWEAPPNPDPQVILNEASADTRAGRYEDALAKHLWFHHHVLEHDRSYFGVRLSFALTYWHELGKAYPPALEKLKETRDDAAKLVFANKDKVWDAFIDMSAINDQLGEGDRTVAAFARLDKEAPKAAKKVYELAQPALLKAGQLALCGKYLEPEKSYAKMVRLYRVQLELPDDQKSAARKRRELDFAEDTFLEQAATLIALLVLNEREPEAAKIAEDARSKSKHQARDLVIDTALDGTLPKRRNE